MMVVARILAKSSETPELPLPPETLAGHLLSAGLVALEIASRRAEAVCSALGLDAAAWAAPLGSATLRAALLHDLGKANEQFQRVVRRVAGARQSLRHEAVALWIVATNPDLDRWLFQGQPAMVRLAALRAILAHHLKGYTSVVPAPAHVTRVRVHLGHPDVADALTGIGQQLGLGDPPRLSDVWLDLDQRGLAPLRALTKELYDWWERASAEERRFGSAVAGLLDAADVCSSIVVRQGLDPAAWADAALREVCTGADLRGAALGRLGGQQTRRFQDDVAASSTRLTLVTAGCGSGKTVAAYLWAARRLAGRKLFFCYPTTGTASEGFQDYAYPEFAQDAALVHSRAELDIERILDNGADRDAGDGTDEASAAQVSFRYQGLRLWSSKAIVCTADAVLGLMQHYRVGLFGLPALASGGFVFDEIHLYDDRMFGSLLAFLEAFRGVPVLLMTATLQPGRWAALASLAERLGEGICHVQGPPDLERLPRYELSAATPEAALRQAVDAARSGQRVLWVVNTVNRAIQLARKVEGHPVGVEVYHSRFRYTDRIDRHRAVVDRFKRNGAAVGVVAITTQVCEVSLDISADLLVTELAPIAALIQRLGRLNRWAATEDSVRPALVVEPPDPLPYADAELAQARRWLELVQGRPTSQRDLAEHASRVVGQELVVAATRSIWLDEPLDYRPGWLRDTDSSVSVIRAEDRPRCIDARGRPIGREITAHSIPLPWGPVAARSRDWERLGTALVAPAGAIAYSERLGAQWSQ